LTIAMNDPSAMCGRNASLNERYAIRDLSSTPMQLYHTVALVTTVTVLWQKNET